jgi:hypothetical protein
MLLVRADNAVGYQAQFTAAAMITGVLFVLANLVSLGLRCFPA